MSRPRVGNPFLKYLKPVVYIKSLFCQSIFDPESKRQKANGLVIRRYLEKWLFNVNEYMEERHVKVQYDRCRFKHMDEQYFLRENSEIPLELKNSRQLLDEEFFTWHNHAFSVIMANEMLADYIREEIEKLENPGMDHSTDSTPAHQWSGKKIDLADLVYGLYYGRLVDAGKISIRELADMFGGLFWIDLGKDIYRLHTEIQQRKIDRTKFLDFLISILRQRLDDDDK
ncbi:MAG: RteC domain-containing protein [Mangrovibacterium sp.]